LGRIPELEKRMLDRKHRILVGGGGCVFVEEGREGNFDFF
jgi:hypothetical protein